MKMKRISKRTKEDILEIFYGRDKEDCANIIEIFMLVDSIEGKLQDLTDQLRGVYDNGYECPTRPDPSQIERTVERLRKITNML